MKKVKKYNRINVSVTIEMENFIMKEAKKHKITAPKYVRLLVELAMKNKIFITEE